jgi:hypothetical protein
LNEHNTGGNVEHTPDKWIPVGKYAISVNADNTVGASFDKPADRDKAVACVNAMQGLNPEGVKDVVEALEGCIEHMEHSTPQGRQAWESATAALAKIKTATTKDQR